MSLKPPEPMRSTGSLAPSSSSLPRLPGLLSLFCKYVYNKYFSYKSIRKQKDYVINVSSYVDQNKALKTYKNHQLSLTTQVCFIGTLQAIAVTFVMEHKSSVWKIGWDMNLLAAAYAVIFLFLSLNICLCVRVHILVLSEFH